MAFAHDDANKLILGEAKHTHCNSELSLFNTCTRTAVNRKHSHAVIRLPLFFQLFRSFVWLPLASEQLSQLHIPLRHRKIVHVSVILNDQEDENRNISTSQAKRTYVVPVVGVEAETEQLEAHRHRVFSVESFHCDM